MVRRGCCCSRISATTPIRACSPRARTRAALYALAVDVLIALNRRFAAAAAQALPPYDEHPPPRRGGAAGRLVSAGGDRYLRPPQALREAYLALWRSLLPLARGVPPTLVLRDYHVDNLMRLAGARRASPPSGSSISRTRCWGPMSYDLVSLLEDARRDVAVALAARPARALSRRVPGPRSRRLRDALMRCLGAQRNSKIVGIFTRLLRARRQAALSRPYPAGVAAHRERICAIPISRR